MTKPYESEAIGNMADQDPERLDQLREDFNQLLNRNREYL